jgi:hypothetical protein
MSQDPQNGEEQEPIPSEGSEPKAPLSIQVGVENGRVIVIFSEALTTFSLPHEEAYKMGGAMILHADEAKTLVEAEEEPGAGIILQG